MTKGELKTIVTETKSEVREAILTIYSSLNQGQKKKVLKDEKVRRLFEKYGIDEKS